MGLDLGKCLDVARRSLLICCAKGLICPSYSIFEVGGVLVPWGKVEAILDNITKAVLDD